MAGYINNISCINRLNTHDMLQIGSLKEIFLPEIGRKKPTRTQKLTHLTLE